MRILKPGNVREFTDEAGDCLVLRSFATKAQIALEEDRGAEVAGKFRKKAGFTLDEISRLEEIQAEVEKEEGKASKKKKLSAEIQKLRFECLAVEIRLKDPSNPEEITIINTSEGLRETYDNMDPESGAWVDDCVNQIWEQSKPTDEEKN